MINSSWSQRVAEVMGELSQEFSQDELAYLALTSKVELPIRDRLAYTLNRRYGDGGRVVVAREWQRVDLAVIVDQKPKLLLEAKAMYILNMWTPYRSTFLNMVRNDRGKLENNYPDTSVEKMLLAVATDCHCSPEKSLDKVVKYSGDIRKYNKARRSEKEVYQAANEMFREFKHFSSGRIPGGNAFDMEASVYYWLFGPY